MFKETVYDTVPENDDVLVITEREEIAAECKRKGIAVIGVEKENTRVWSADYVVNSRDDVDNRLKELVFARHKGVAFMAFETDRLSAFEIDMASREEVLAFIDDLMKEAGDANKATEGKCRATNKIFTFDKGFLEEEEYLKSYIENQYAFYGFGMWRIIEKDTGEMVGLASLNVERGEVLTMGYAIKKARRRMGFAREMCEGVLSFAKDTGFKQAFVRISKGNESSIALAKSLGFKELNEEYADCIFYINLI